MIGSQVEFLLVEHTSHLGLPVDARLAREVDLAKLLLGQLFWLWLLAFRDLIETEDGKECMSRSSRECEDFAVGFKASIVLLCLR